MLVASVSEHCCDESGVVTQVLQHRRAGLICGCLRRWPAPFTHPHQPFLLKSSQNPVRKKLLYHLCARSPSASQFERPHERFIHPLQAQSNIDCFEAKLLQRVQSDKLTRSSQVSCHSISSCNWPSSAFRAVSTAAPASLSVEACGEEPSAVHDLSASDNRLPHARWGCIQHQLPKFAALRGWGVERNGAAGATRARTSARVAPARQPNQQGTTPHDSTPDIGVTRLAVTAHGSWQDARHTTVGREMIILAHRGNLHACPAPSRALSLTTPARATCHARAPCSPPSPAWTPLPLRTGVPQEEAWGGLQSKISREGVTHFLRENTLPGCSGVHCLI